MSTVHQGLSIDESRTTTMLCAGNDVACPALCQDDLPEAIFWGCCNVKQQGPDDAYNAESKLSRGLDWTMQ
jgi:hypothetical protein